MPKTKSLTLVAMEKIREGITSGKYALGSPLYEKVLAAQYGISKTPVREALQQLQHEGLVVVQPHSGTFVFELADGEVADLCELRLILETNALQLSMRRQTGRLIADLKNSVQGMRESLKTKEIRLYRTLDTRFHRAFFSYSGNSALARNYELIEAKLETMRVSLLTPMPQLLQSSVKEHAQIVEVLSDGNVSAAIDILATHIKRGRELMRDLHEAKPIQVTD